MPDSHYGIWQARRESNPQPAVLETAALPIELLALNSNQAGNYADLNNQNQRLLDDLGNHAGANGTAAFANRETQTVFHGDRSDQGNNHLDVVARHHHLNAFRQLAVTGHVSGTEVELR